MISITSPANYFNVSFSCCCQVRRAIDGLSRRTLKSGRFNSNTAECNGRKVNKDFLRSEELYAKESPHNRLTADQLLIVGKHDLAISKGQFTYDDPATGYKVFTRLRHFLRGSCCGNGCRHCIYDHENVL